MKKLLITATLLATAFLSGCGADDGYADAVFSNNFLKAKYGNPAEEANQFQIEITADGKATLLSGDKKKFMLNDRGHDINAYRVIKDPKPYEGTPDDTKFKYEFFNTEVPHQTIYTIRYQDAALSGNYDYYASRYSFTLTEK
ncbi:hypothetical protein AB4229_14345 [Vibrio breoganii]